LRITPVEIEIANIFRVGDLETQKQSLNIYGLPLPKPSDDEPLKKVVTEIVKANLLSVIVDENSITKKNDVKESWETKINSEAEFLKAIKSALEN
jgi:hypothetical protein